MQEILTNAEKHLHRMFLAGAILGALSCFARADFNLPLYAFLYIMWDQDDNNKLKLMLLLAITFLGDFLWLVYWVPHWWSDEGSKLQSGLHNFVIFCSFANFLLKLVVLGTLATVKAEDLKNAQNDIQQAIKERQGRQ